MREVYKERFVEGIQVETRERGAQIRIAITLHVERAHSEPLPPERERDFLGASRGLRGWSQSRDM